MEYVTLNNGVKMPILGYGVYQVTKDECERCVLDALEAGYRSIDTAQSYFNEEEVGNAIQKSGIPREEIFLTTKVWVEHYGYEEAKKSVLESMKKLKTDYLDLVLLHQPFSDAYGAYHALEDLYDEGKIKAIGAANVDINHIQEYIKYGDLDIIQCKYSILDRGIEDEIIPCARENGITIQCYSPLEMGLLSGTFPRDYKPVGAQIPKKWFQPENMQNAMDMMDSWKPLCEKYDCTIANLALGWILAQGDFLNLLSGSTTVDQIRENVKSAELELDPEDVAFMRESAEAIDK